MTYIRAGGRLERTLGFLGQPMFVDSGIAQSLATAFKVLQAEINQTNATLSTHQADLDTLGSEVDPLRSGSGGIDSGNFDTPFGCAGQIAVWRSIGSGLTC